MAMQILVSHEIAHVLLGHVAYSSFKGTRTSEVSARQSEREIMQLFEIEADLHTPFIYLGRRQLDLHVQKAHKYFEMTGIDSSPDTFVRLLAMATGIVWTLLGVANEHSNVIDVHPDPFFRYVMTRDAWSASFMDIEGPGGDERYEQGRRLWMRDIDSLVLILDRVVETLPSLDYRKRDVKFANSWFLSKAQEFQRHRHKWKEYCLWERKESPSLIWRLRNLPWFR
jgi:hypothetical protein